MKLGKLTCVAVSLCLISQVQAKDLTIENNTDHYGTASISYVHCTSEFGSAGIIAPHSRLTLSKTVIDTVCVGLPCVAHFYDNNKCKGKQIGNVKVSARKGILSTNDAPNSNYHISKTSADSIKIDPV